MAEEAAGARRRGLLDEGSRFLTQLGTMDEHQRTSLLLAHIRGTIEQVRQGLMFPLDAVVTLALTVSYRRCGRAASLNIGARAWIPLPVLDLPCHCRFPRSRV